MNERLGGAGYFSLGAQFILFLAWLTNVLKAIKVYDTEQCGVMPRNSCKPLYA